MKRSFRTIAKPSTGLYKEKGSKFLGFAFPVTGEAEIEQRLESLRKQEHGARHHCYAWKLGLDDNLIRANDDGEPGNSAGKPILGQIEKYDLTNILIVVVRYFGGTKLGVGGLINAYRTAATSALDDSQIVEHQLTRRLKLKFAYDQMGNVMTIARTNNIEVYDQKFELACSLILKVPEELEESLIGQIALLNNVELTDLGIQG